jgi:hypothetical protein
MHTNFPFHVKSGKTSSNVVLWGERATSFPGEQVCKEGQTSPQVVIFVGTLARNYAGRQLVHF